MGEIVLMLHVANVACCNSHGGGQNNIHYFGITCTHCQRQRAEGEYFVIPLANFFLMFYCPFRKKKRYICRRGALNNLNCRKPQKRSRKPIAGLRQIMYLCTCNVTKNTTTN